MGFILCQEWVEGLIVFEDTDSHRGDIHSSWLVMVRNPIGDLVWFMRHWMQQASFSAIEMLELERRGN